MACSHCTGPEREREREMMGFCFTLNTVHTTQGQGQVTEGVKLSSSIGNFEVVLRFLCLRLIGPMLFRAYFCALSHIYAGA